MKKKLLALAVAGAFVAPVAMADTANVSIYGQANVSFDSTDNNPDGGSGSRANKISSNGSRLGFKGSESLGGGTSAIWQIETAVAIDNSGTTGQGLGTRDTYAGLKGESWGTLTLGRADNAYKGSTRRLDLFDETLADNRSLVGLMFDMRNPNSANYTTPNMSGFSIAATVLAGAENASVGGQTKGTGYALAGMYDAGPVYATLAYASVNPGSKTTGDLAVDNIPGAVVDQRLSAWKLGAGYNVDQFGVTFVYERNRNDAANNSDLKAWYLAGKFNISGSDAVKLAYARAKMDGGSDNTGKQVSVGYDHAMSKRTTVYALYTRLNNDRNAVYGLATNPDIESTGNVPVSAGADPSAFSIGMKHTF